MCARASILMVAHLGRMGSESCRVRARPGESGLAKLSHVSCLSGRAFWCDSAFWGDWEGVGFWATTVPPKRKSEKTALLKHEG